MKSIAIIALLLLLCCKPPEKSMRTATLENTYWKLSEMNGQPVITPEGDREVHIILAKDGAETRLKGFAGCNNMGGSYSLRENSIKFTVISTKMMCSERMDIENFLFSALEKADRYEINGETLQLYQGNKLLIVFESVYLK
jgi:heat shock protein HslJ